MVYTVLMFEKIQFTGDWVGVFSPDKLVVAYQPLVATGKVLVVTETPGIGVQTYEFIVPQPQNVIVSTQKNMVEFPVSCRASVTGDVTKCV